jgi:hypothetical protein
LEISGEGRKSKTAMGGATVVIKMKTSRVILLGAGTVSACFLLQAQTALVGRFNDDLAPVQAPGPDSIVQVTAEAYGLPPVAYGDLPRFGTYWEFLPGGGAAPLPCPPDDSTLPLFSITDNIFLVDATGGQAFLPARRTSLMSARNLAASALDAQATAVAHLIDQIQTTALTATPLGMQMMSMSVSGPPGFGDGGSGTNTYTPNGASYTVPNYGTNLWIAQTAVTNDLWTGIASNTIADVSYEVQSRTNLVQTDWLTEGFFSGSELTNWTPFSVWQNNRNGLFLRLRSWLDSYNIGIPDWWQFQYFGTNGIDPYASVAGDGYDNLAKFELGLNPTNYYNPNAMTGFFGSLDATGTNVILYWQPAPGPVVNYAIQRGILNTNTSAYVYSAVGPANSNATFFKDAGAVNNANAQNDIYNLTAVYPGGSGSATNTWNVWWYARAASAGPPYGPPVPGNLWANADVTGTNVILSWLTPSSAATNYLIFRGRFNPTNYTYQYLKITNVSPGTTNFQVFGGLTNGSNWTEAYEVQAVYPGGGLSAPVTTLPDYSSFSSIHTGANTNGPAAPGNFYGYPDATGTNLLLTWNPVAGAVTNYLIYGGVFDYTTYLIVYHQLAKLGAATNSFAVVGGIDGSGHNLYSRYDFVAVYTNGSLSQSTTWYPGVGAPAPSSLYAYLDTTGTNVQLAWSAATGAITSYVVQRSDDYGWDYYPIGNLTTNKLTFQNTNAVNDGAFDLTATVYAVQAAYANGGLSPAVTAMVSNTPPSPSSLSATVDSTGTNVYLSWTPALGAVTGYDIERGTFNQATGAYDYTQIAQVGPAVTSFSAVGAYTNRKTKPDIYKAVAVFAGGSLSAPDSAVLIQPPFVAVNLSVTAFLVRNQAGRWQVMFSGIPTNAPAVQLTWTDTNGVSLPQTIPTTNLTDGIYPIPDANVVNVLGDSLVVQAVAPDGQLGKAASAGVLANDAPYFVDGRQHMKQNLSFLIRAAALNEPLGNTIDGYNHSYASLKSSIDASRFNQFATNFEESSFLHFDAGLDNLWPFTANYNLANLFIDTSRTNINQDPLGISNFVFQINFATNIPAPASLTHSDPYWILQPGFYGVDYNAASWGLTVTSNNTKVSLQSGLKNLFGLPYQTGCEVDLLWYEMNPENGEPVLFAIYQPLAPGGSVTVEYPNAEYEIGDYASGCPAPSLQFANYYFASLINPNNDAMNLPGMSQQPSPLPIDEAFNVTNQTPPIIVGTVGQPMILGGWAKYAISNSTPTKYAYLGQYFNTNAVLLNSTGTATTNSAGILSPYGEFFPMQAGQAQLVTMPDIDSGVQGTGVVRVIALNADANHDGQMEFKYNSPDFVSASKPFRFWANDNQDDGDFGGNDGIPGANKPDGTTPVQVHNTGVPNLSFPSIWSIHGRRDLVDFFPVYLNVGSLFQSNALSAGISATDTNYQFVLSQADGVLRFAYTSLTPTNYMNFLLDTNVSGILANAPLTTISNTGVALLPAFVRGMATNNQSIILVEATTATTQPLILSIYHGTNQIGQTSLPLSITGVEQMFRSKTMLLHSAPEMVPDRLTDADVPNEPDTVAKNFVFVHGYNVLPDEARGSAADVFKRMYWAGSHAKFWAVTWQGADSKGTFPFNMLLTPNYHTNVVNAFNTAATLANFIASLTNSGPVVELAHSLGNILTLSAINDWNAPLSQYFMMDAAVPIEAIDPTATTNMMILSTWTGYTNRLTASKWYQLFATNDYRSTLSWNNRLGNLRNVDVYNFYSSGEEVLRTYTNDPPASVLGKVLTQITDFWPFGIPFGSYTWYWQEKGKGTCSQDWFLGSSHGGWKFNSSYDIFTPSRQHLPPDQAATNSTTMLQTNAFFDFGNYTLSKHPDYIHLQGSDGSSYAQTNRNRILADAIPAMSVVAGANPVPRFSVNDHNFDMMAFENGWPLGRTGKEVNMWHHSDYHNVAYTFTYNLFNQFVTTGNLK